MEVNNQLLMRNLLSTVHENGDIGCDSVARETIMEEGIWKGDSHVVFDISLKYFTFFL